MRGVRRRHQKPYCNLTKCFFGTNLAFIYIVYTALNKSTATFGSVGWCGGLKFCIFEFIIVQYNMRYVARVLIRVTGNGNTTSIVIFAVFSLAFCLFFCGLYGVFVCVCVSRLLLTKVGQSDKLNREETCGRQIGQS